MGLQYLELKNLNVCIPKKKRRCSNFYEKNKNKAGGGYLEDSFVSCVDFPIVLYNASGNQHERQEFFDLSDHQYCSGTYGESS